MKDYTFIHDSYDAVYREPFGAVPCGNSVTLRLSVPHDFSGSCSLRLWVDNSEQLFSMQPCDKTLQTSGKLLEATVKMPVSPSLIWYYFCIYGDSTRYCGSANCYCGGKSSVFDAPPPAYQITVYEPTITPKWWKAALIYQIFPDRFFNGRADGSINPAHSGSLVHTDWYDTPSYHRDVDGRITHWDFFGGNLSGITKKLDYLKDFGISVLYLNPIFESRSNHRYDTGDYKKIDPMLGTDEDFDTLIAEAKKRNINIILDGVFSHTGSDSRYFNKYGHYGPGGAANSSHSPYYSWYTFTDYPDKYQCWWDIDDLPNVDEMNPDYRKFICEGEDSVVRHWMRRGIKGFRLDVADELPDDFIELLRKAIKDVDPDGILLGEVWEDASNKMAYDVRRRYFYGYELDGVMNYPFRDAMLGFACGRIDGATAQSLIMRIIENYPMENLLGSMTLLGSHDRPRTLTLLALSEDDSLDGLPKDMTDLQKEAYRLSREQYDLGKQRLQMLVAFQMALPGAPSVYYGDEAGMEGFSDPYNRGSYPWGKEDLDLQGQYTDLLHMRRNYLTELVSGSYRPLSLPPNCMGFRLEKGEYTVLICMNRSSSHDCRLTFTLPSHSQKCMELVSGDMIVPKAENSDGTLSYTLILPRLSTRIFYFCQIKNKITMPEGQGILLHPTSLPTPWRTGDFGANAYAFVDFLVSKRQTYWQILPLDSPDFGSSPYQALCCQSGNPVLISMEALMQQGLLTSEELDTALNILDGLTKNIPPKLTCFQEASELKADLLRISHTRFSMLPHTTDLRLQYEAFLSENSRWLPDFALFLTMREINDGAPWYQWNETALKHREPEALRAAFEEYAQDVDYHSFVQFIFASQWQKLKSYCHDKGIFIIGDLPMYVSGNSSDVWVNPQLFSLYEDGQTKLTAGVPGDYFNPKGQSWGCPVFRWDKMKDDGFDWWKKRMRHAISLYDYIRLDHFRGFDAHWAAQYEGDTVISGSWCPTPGQALLESLLEQFDSLPLIAEDLGFITAPVKNLKNQFDLPGMEIYMFSDLLRYGDDLSSLSHTLVYTGTHDNDTLSGWYTKECLNNGLPTPTDEECLHYCKSVITTLAKSPAPWVIIPLQDFFALPTSARMNLPGTMGGTNWRWMISESLWKQMIS